MADVAVENPANQVPPHKRPSPSSIPNFDSLEGFSSEASDDYSTFKRLQRQLECVSSSAGHRALLTPPQVHPPTRGIHQGRAEVRIASPRAVVGGGTDYGAGV